MADAVAFNESPNGLSAPKRPIFNNFTRYLAQNSRGSRKSNIQRESGISFNYEAEFEIYCR